MGRIGAPRRAHDRAPAGRRASPRPGCPFPRRGAGSPGAASGRRGPPGRTWRTGRRVGVLLAVVLAVGAGGAAAGEADRPRILHVALPAHLAVGMPGAARVTYRAPGADVVALVQVLEDLEGARRATLQRELDVIPRAFGREAGELVVPLSFTTPGRKRLVLWLVTDERRESDPETLEIEVAP